MNNVVRSAWAAQAKTLAFATLSIGGLLTPAYTTGIETKAILINGKPPALLGRLA